MDFDEASFWFVLILGVLFAYAFYIYNPVLFYYESSLDILYEAVTNFNHGRFVTLEVGLRNVNAYFDFHAVFGARSPIFMKDDRENRWIVVLKGRFLPLLGPCLSVEANRVEPEQNYRKRFIFKVSILEGDDVLFYDMTIANTSNLVQRDCLLLDTRLKMGGSPLNLRIRIDICVIDDVTTVCAGFTEAIPKSNVLSQMHSSKDHSDCVIKTCDRDLLGHKAVLTSTSDKFTHEMVDGVVDFRDVMDGDAASDLLQYIYLRKTQN